MRTAVPDTTERRQVEAMAAYGIPEPDIARIVGLDPATLRTHYADELDTGHIKANSRIAESLYNKATGSGREAVTASIFWLKCRAGWKETSVRELTGKDSEPLTVVIQRFGDDPEMSDGP